MKKNKLLFIASFFISVSVHCCLPLVAQSPYSLTFKKELVFAGASGIAMGLGGWMYSQHPAFTIAELNALEIDDVFTFDRFATGNFSERADKASDVFLYGTPFVPLLFLAGKKSRSHFGQVIVMYGEAATLNVGLTVAIKSIARRPRPFLFNADVGEDLKLTRTATTSFLSGHTSLTALNTFFAAKVFADFYPDSQWKPVVWSLGAAIPALTGYLRVAAGKHYLSDVVAGYALGGAIGILVPHLHKNKILKENGISLQMGYNGINIRWQFNR